MQQNTAFWDPGLQKSVTLRNSQIVRDGRCFKQNLFTVQQATVFWDPGL